MKLYKAILGLYLRKGTSQNEMPVNVDVSGGEASIGGSRTLSKYTQNGGFRWTLGYYQPQFLSEMSLF